MKSTRPPERICLLTGGGYPYRQDALSGWCRTLVEGLADYRFALITVTDREAPAAPAYPLPANVISAQATALPRDRDRYRDQSPGHEQHRNQRRRHDQHREHGRRERPNGNTGASAAALLCAGLLGNTDREQSFTAGLRQLAQLAVADPSALATTSLTQALLDAWRAAGKVYADPDQLPLPRLSVRDARTAATLLRHALGALAVPLPEADLLHCVGGTTPLLAALATRWRTGIPLLLTEARTPLARHRPTEERQSPAVRTVLRRFRGAVARAGYAEAALIAPLSAYHHGWALRHGARAERLVQVPAGVDPLAYPSAPEREAEPAVVWAGSGGPDSGLAGLLAAFAQVVATLPSTVLHLVAITTTNLDWCTAQIERAGLQGAGLQGAGLRGAGLRGSVRLHPQPADPRDRYSVGHVVVHLPGPADPPYRLIEAMMSGRAVVAVDVGPAAETLGDAGVLVSPDQPTKLALAIVGLLRAPQRRRALGEAARARALAYYTQDRVVRVYGELYTDLLARTPTPTVELALALSAPRTTQPATIRWLTAHDR